MYATLEGMNEINYNIRFYNGRSNSHNILGITLIIDGHLTFGKNDKSLIAVN